MFLPKLALPEDEIFTLNASFYVMKNYVSTLQDDK